MNINKEKFSNNYEYLKALYENCNWNEEKIEALNYYLTNWQEEDWKLIEETFLENDFNSSEIEIAKLAFPIFLTNPIINFFTIENFPFFIDYSNIINKSNISKVKSFGSDFQLKNITDSRSIAPDYYLLFSSNNNIITAD